jgi:hypothetical protein
MENLLFLFILVLLCIVLYRLHRNSNTRLLQKHKSTSSAKPQAKKYHGTSIHLCSQACGPVSRLEGKIFLPSEITALPIHGCTNPTCTCSYLHHDDRRSKDDRRYPSLVMTGVYNAKEHRSNSSERRKQSFA